MRSILMTCPGISRTMKHSKSNMELLEIASCGVPLTHMRRLWTICLALYEHEQHACFLTSTAASREPFGVGLGPKESGI